MPGYQQSITLSPFWPRWISPHSAQTSPVSILLSVPGVHSPQDLGGLALSVHGSLLCCGLHRGPHVDFWGPPLCTLLRPCSAGPGHIRCPDLSRRLPCSLQPLSSAGAPGPCAVFRRSPLEECWGLWAPLVGSPLKGHRFTLTVAHRLPSTKPNLIIVDRRRSYLSKMQKSQVASFPLFNHSWPLVLLRIVFKFLIWSSRLCCPSSPPRFPSSTLHLQ